MVKICTGAVGGLLVAYLALIAVVVGYASVTIEYGQSIKIEESRVAALESAYLAHVAEMTKTDVAADGYTLPVAKTYVPTKSVTAVR